MFEQRDCVLKLKRNVYGLRQAPLNFFLLLKEALEQRGFQQSEFEPCLFASRDVVCLCYVDDCIFYAQNEKSIHDIINEIAKSLKSKDNDQHINRH